MEYKKKVCYSCGIEDYPIPFMSGDLMWGKRVETKGTYYLGLTAKICFHCETTLGYEGLGDINGIY